MASHAHPRRYGQFGAHEDVDIQTGVPVNPKWQTLGTSLCKEERDQGYNWGLRPALQDVFDAPVSSAGGGLFFKEVDIADFSARRSLRRGSTQHATNQGVSQQVIDEANRWRTKEAARGSEAYLPLRQVYTSVRHVLPTRIRYPQSL